MKDSAFPGATLLRAARSGQRKNLDKLGKKNTLGWKHGPCL